jgi:putative (di)nucleoside polyphosphate hydrolase
MPDGWQMPQGGVDRGETPIEAACRELAEEIGTTRALLLRESREWITYDVPAAQRPPHWKGRWHGQAQKWFALAFTGRDSDIDLTAHEREFDEWRWVPAAELPGLIVPFKRAVYDTVLAEFSDLIGARHP